MSHIEEPPAKVLKIDNQNGTEQAEGTEVVSADDSDLTEVSDPGDLMADSAEMAEASDIIGVSAMGAVPTITEVKDIEAPEIQESELEMPGIQDSDMDMPGVKESKMEMPRSQGSEMDMPENHESEMSGVQDSEISGVRQSDMDMPDVQESDIEMPGIQEPENFGDSNMTEIPGITESKILVSDLIQVSDLTGANIKDMTAETEKSHTSDTTVPETDVNNTPVNEVTSNVEAVEPSEGQEQEEWLSEGVLTDDDFNPAAQDQTDSQSSQLENGVTEAPSKVEDTQTMEQPNIASIFEKKSTKSVQQNIEDALNTLEGNDEQNDDLDKYLIKKSDMKTESKHVKTENLEQEQDDGNDTDDLLRMLGEDDSKAKKKLTKTVKDIRATVKSESSDDDFVFEGVMPKKLKIAKAQSKKTAVKTEQEHSDAAAGQSSDEASTLQKMFKNTKSSKTAKQTVVNKPRSDAKSAGNLAPKKDKLATSTPLRPVAPKGRSLLKANMTPQTPLRAVHVKREPGVLKTYSRVKNAVQTPPIFKPNEPEKPKMEAEEYLDEDFDIQDDELESDFDEEVTKRQRMRRPERMEEEMSEGDSHSEDGSLYDELPSSDSEDMEDWFQLDIRAEKAGDYLPLMGPQAKQLLLEEKKRCALRLTNLKQSLSALTESGKKQAELVRTATLQLAELDDMLKSS